MASDKGQTTVLTLTKEWLEVTQINLDKVPEKTLYAKSDWSPETLETKLTQIKSKFNTGTLRVILDDIAKTSKEYKSFTKLAEKLGIELTLVETMKVASELYKDPVLGLALQEQDTPVEKVSVQENLPEEVDAITNQASGSLEEDLRKPKSNKRLILIFPIALILVVTGIYLLLSSRSDSSPTQSPSPTVAPPVVILESPSPDPEEVVDLANFSVQVLNGSGIAGKAAEVEAQLEDEGFESIETGNADNFDYIATEINLKPNLPSALRLAIESALVGYDLEFQSDLEDDNDYDIVIIIGTPPEE